MSGLYYVLLKWAPDAHSNSTMLTFNILCFSSRYDADEFYRELPTVRYSGTPLFSRLSRSSPQFWTHESPHTTYREQETSNAVYYLFQYNLLSKFNHVVTLANNSVTHTLMNSPNSVTGPDWLSEGTYFIRNRRQPDLYWWVHDDHIHTSQQRRTKFRIQQVTPSDNAASGCCKPVLIRGDKVRIDVVSETTESAGARERTKFVSIRDGKGKSNCLSLTNNPKEWAFEDLLIKKVGVRWGDEIPEEKGQARPLLVFMPNGGGDEWELC